MNIVFRADSSIEIGVGHVMRCLSLADALTKLHFNVTFICRKLQGNINSLILERKYKLYELPFDGSAFQNSNNLYANWLGTTWEQDAEDTKSVVESIKPDFLIVDHYSLDAKWETQLKAFCRKLIVIDDLANRKHVCDVIIDQTYGREVDEYYPYIEKSCLCLLGAKYAILRPEFSELRRHSLERRRLTNYDKVFVSLGGIDKNNITGEVLEALACCSLPASKEVTVVLGSQAPHQKTVMKLIEDLPYQARLLVGVTNIAEIMANSDLAIGAAGSSAWERCCLGLPTLMIVIADNQKTVASRLAANGAAILLEQPIKEFLISFFSEDNLEHLENVSAKSAQLIDGLGCERIIDKIEVKLCQNN